MIQVPNVYSARPFIGAASVFGLTCEVCLDVPTLFSFVTALRCSLTVIFGMATGFLDGVIR